MAETELRPVDGAVELLAGALPAVVPARGAGPADPQVVRTRVAFEVGALVVNPSQKGGGKDTSVTDA